MVRPARYIASLAVIALLLYPERVSSSCVNLERPLCQQYADYGVVFDGTVESVEAVDPDDFISRNLEPIPHRLATFAIHRAWKGVSTDRIQLLLRGGLARDGRMIIDVSDELRLERGSRYVIFGNVDPNGFVRASGCFPTVPYHAAVEVLEFLYSLDRPPTGGLVTGSVRTRWPVLGPGTHQPPLGVTRVTLSGVNVHRSVEVKEGRFEFGGLPTGKFSVSVLRPPGMMKAPVQTVTIATPRSCESLWITNIPDTRVTGVVMSGQTPLEGVRIDLGDGAITTYTDAAGSFQVEGIPPGRYVVVKALRAEPEGSIRRSVHDDRNKPLEVVVTTRKPVALGVLRFGPLFGVTPELELRPVADPVRR